MHNYIYSFKYHYHHKALCKLESLQVFGEAEKDNLLFSNIKVSPSISPFIKSRFEISSSSESYSELIANIKEKKICVEGFKAEYTLLDDDETKYKDRLQCLRDVGFSIEGEPDYYTPSIIYSICQYKKIWYFGVLIKHNADWQKHKVKPFSFSNSITIEIAKTLVNIASKGIKAEKLLDACCGVGTVMLEACISDYDIDGCDINWRACRKTRGNLAHYNYVAKVYLSDIKDLDKQYDAAIVDLPYNLYTYSTDTITKDILASVAKLTTRTVIVSSTDISAIIKEVGLNITDYCEVEKNGNPNFTRSIWLCEMTDNPL